MPAASLGKTGSTVFLVAQYWGEAPRLLPGFGSLLLNIATATDTFLIREFYDPRVFNDNDMIASKSAPDCFFIWSVGYQSIL